MTSQYKVVFRLEGPEKNNHHLDLSVFANKIKEFEGFLKNTAQDTDENGAEFRVIRVSHSSPTAIECALTNKSGEDAKNIFDNVGINLSSVTEGKADHLPHAVLRQLEKLAKFTPQEIGRAEIQVVNGVDQGHWYQLNNSFRETLAKTRRAEPICISTVDGKLEQINIHNKVKQFTIYTFSSRVTCHFEPQLLNDVQKALGKNVAVSGECLYRPDAAFPYKIIAREMEIFPDSKDLPSFKDIFGIAPNLTGGKTSEQFVRESRDQWDNKHGE